MIIHCKYVNNIKDYIKYPCQSNSGTFQQDALLFNSTKTYSNSDLQSVKYQNYLAVTKK